MPRRVDDLRDAGAHVHKQSSKPAKAAVSMKAYAIPDLSRRIFRYLGGAPRVIVQVASAATAGWLYVQKRGNLAQLDGEAAVPGATAAIVIDRDALGISTIRACMPTRSADSVSCMLRIFFPNGPRLATSRGRVVRAARIGSHAIDTWTRMLRLRARASALDRVELIMAPLNFHLRHARPILICRAVPRAPDTP
jgi:hypothetical protein